MGGIALLLLFLALLVAVASVVHMFFPLLLLSPPTQEWLTRTDEWMQAVFVLLGCSSGSMCLGAIFGAIAWKRVEPRPALGLAGFICNALGLLVLGSFWLLDALSS